MDIRPLQYYQTNTLVLYLPMYEELWEGVYFAFKEGSDELLFFIDAGGEPADYRKKKQLLNDLYRKAGQ